MKVYELLNHPRKWIKSCLARNKQGDSVNSRSRQAAKWCLVGALEKCYGPEWTGSKFQAAEAKLREATQKLFPQFGGDIVCFNNDENTTFRMLRAVIRKAKV